VEEQSQANTRPAPASTANKLQSQTHILLNFHKDGVHIIKYDLNKIDTVHVT